MHRVRNYNGIGQAQDIEKVTLPSIVILFVIGASNSQVLKRLML
jgi:hypothetical protein